MAREYRPDQSRHWHIHADGRQHLYRGHDDQRRDAADRQWRDRRITGNIVDNGALTFNRTDTLTYGGVDQRHRLAHQERDAAR